MKKELLLKIVVFALVICVLQSVLITPVSAFNYQKINLGSTKKGDLQDYFGCVSYELVLNDKKTVGISYSSTVPSDFCVYDGKLNTVYKASSTKKLTKSLTLYKGNYVFSFYNCGYKKGSYRLTLKDNTVYTKSISFKKNYYNVSCGGIITPLLVKTPSSSVIKSIKYATSNNQIATVSSRGKVRGVDLGRVKLVAKLNNGETARCFVTVNKKVINVSRNQTKILPKVDKETVKWKSNNTSVVKVYSSTLKAVKKGTATLTANVNGVKYTTIVNVK